jgi:glycosyltransferase involved in cell wall biosynthesis
MSRLLILCEYPTLLGGERSLLALLGAVAAAGFDVHVAAPADGPLADELRARSVWHVAWQVRSGAGQRLPVERLRPELADLIRGVRPDLVHANSLSTARMSGPVVAKLGVPSIGHLRDIVKLSPPAVADLNAHRRLLAVSSATRNYHVLQGLEATKCHVVYNGVDLAAFRTRRPTGYLHSELGLQPSARLVITIGQLGLRKATDVVLYAALRVAAELPDVHWLIVGRRTSDKEESRRFEELLHELAVEPPLAGRVHFLGERDDVAQLMAECVLMVHAARQEPLGRVLLEAAACGLAVIATDVGGTREIFPTEANGAVLVPPDNRVALADTMTALVNNDARRHALGQGGRRRAETAFDVRVAAARLVGQYAAVLNR